MKFVVIDNTGNAVRSFHSYKEASCFKIANNRLDWKIKEIFHKRNSTEKQKKAIKFCEQMLSIKFDGNIDDFYQVHYFLLDNLEEAKMLYTELKCDYESDREY